MIEQKKAIYATLGKEREPKVVENERVLNLSTCKDNRGQGVFYILELLL